MHPALSRHVPDLLKPLLADYFQRYCAAGASPDVLDDPLISDSIGRVWAASDFVATTCIRQPDLLRSLAEGSGLRQSASEGVFAPLDQESPEATFERELRLARHREMARVSWRDLAGLATLEETLRALSVTADDAIRTALAFQERIMVSRHGVPRDEAGNKQSLIVLAMGKLGGEELNFSSDIDLIFLYPEQGVTDGSNALNNETFFTRLGQRLIRSLDAVTGDGFVFRVDMRLRPFGDSGPLAMNVPALETYLQEHGREWERYAYIKARPVSLPDNCQWLLDDVLKPFVYRRYLDYGVFESLRRMKALIEREVRRRDLQDNIKLGPGGIREIEFIAQTLQLIRGGRETGLQDRRLLPVLDRLAEHDLLPRVQAEALAGAYRYLRKLENCIQATYDRQTHDLPVDPIDRQRVSIGMDAADWTAVARQFDQQRDRVSACFSAIIFGAPGESEADADPRLLEVWEASGVERHYSVPVLEALGFRQPEAILDRLAAFRRSGLLKRLDDTGRRRLDRLVPLLLRAVAEERGQENALQRLLGVIETIGTRSAYLALLLENPAVLKRLTGFCALSGFLADQISGHPLLLDELIDPRIGNVPIDREQLHADLAVRLSHIDAGDIEMEMDAMRQFQRAAVFRIAIADLTGTLPTMKVSDRLTDVAELVLEVAVASAWRGLSTRHGTPMCGKPGNVRPTGFAVIGYGKLGGIELGYGSDLDLVFIHESSGGVQQTDGPDSLDNAVFFSRLARRIVSILTTQTASGTLYKVDMRLRPSGRAGLLVSSLSAFESYQKTEAWTWEHQALLRARAVAGNAELREQFETMRRDLLCHHIGRDTLRDDVRDMRERMCSELSASRDGEFDLKQDAGGIADIEFLVQFSVLSAADNKPELVRYSDNVRQLEALAATRVIDPETADRLREIYLIYRERFHRLALAEDKALVRNSEFAAERKMVRAAWREVMES